MSVSVSDVGMDVDSVLVWADFSVIICKFLFFQFISVFFFLL